MPTAVGSVTKSVFEHTPEAHKLHVEFTVATGQSVRKGDLVVINNDGTIQAAAAAADAHTILGVSIHDAAAGEFATIAMRAYAVVHAEAEAATPAGPVELGVWNATTGMREYDTASAAGKTIGFNLTGGAADGSVILVALLS